MDKILLREHSSGKMRCFETQTGVCRRLWTNTDGSSQAFGNCGKVGGIWFALYADTEVRELIFQTQSWKWSLLDDRLHLSNHLAGRWREFQISGNEIRPFRHRYRAYCQRLGARLDPTYDDFDEMQDDFLLSVCVDFDGPAAASRWLEKLMQLEFRHQYALPK